MARRLRKRWSGWRHLPGAGAGAKAGELTRWRTLPLNSLARQNSDLHLLRNAAPTVVKMLQSTGLNAVPPNLNAMPVSVETWLASPASEGWRLLWLTLPDGKSGVLVPVDGVRNSAALGELATRHPGSSGLTVRPASTACLRSTARCCRGCWAWRWR